MEHPQLDEISLAFRASQIIEFESSDTRQTEDVALVERKPGRCEIGVRKKECRYIGEKGAGSWSSRLCRWLSSLRSWRWLGPAP